MLQKSLTTTTIPDMLEEQVELNPLKVAITDEKNSITYSEFNRRINILAHKLQELGLNKGDYVAIFMEKGIDALVALYAVMKAEGVYVPLDPTYPSDRLNYILDDAKVKLIIKDNSIIDASIPQMNISDIEWVGNESNTNRHIKPTDLAYCIYTSGTTGRPKGVMVEHKGVYNLRNYFTNNLKITKDDVVVQFANLVFDASVWEMTMGLLTGASLVVPSKEEQKDYRKFNEMAKKAKVSVATLPPIFYENLEGFTPRILITAGSESTGEIIRKTSNKTTYINAYGPTEFTVCATHWKYDVNDAIPNRVPIGKPIDNSNCYILNDMQMCPIGVPGELCVSGVGIARGYLNQEQLTAEKFIKNPFGRGNLYRTGDLARWLPDGNIEYLGRIDQQVKIHGFRIELNEIQSSIKKLDYVRDAAVIAKKDPSNELALNAYIVCNDEQDLIRVREELRNTLPEYMIPKYWRRIEDIPVTVNGKLDIRALPEIEINNDSMYIGPSNEFEEMLANIFREVLCQDKVGINDNFVDIGGDSIKAMKLVAKLEGKGYILSISKLLTLQNIKNIEEYLLHSRVKQDVNALVHEDITKLTTIDQVKKYVEQANQDINNKILQGKVAKKYSGTSMQTMLIKTNLLVSGIQIDFDEKVDLDRLTTVINQVIQENELMHSTLNLRNNQVEINEYDYCSTVQVPVIDISDTSDDFKNECMEYFNSLLYSEDTWKQDEIYDKVLFIMQLVKLADNKWSLFMPVCHLIFDGMSGDALKSSIEEKYYNNVDDINMRKPTFEEYSNILADGPKNISQQQIINQFKLNELDRSTQVNLEEFENVSLHIKDTKLKHMSQEDMWNRCFQLFTDLIRFNFDSNHVPIAILCAQRQYQGKKFYDMIGPCLDLLLVPTTFSMKINEVTTLLNTMQEHNINFVELMSRDDMNTQYGEVTTLLKQIDYEYIPIFNFIGMYRDKCDLSRMEYLHENSDLKMTIDIVCSEEEINILGFCRRGCKDDLEEYLK